MPLKYLEKSGKIDQINELEKAGYVKTSKQKGLPGGGQNSEIFLNVRPLKKGKKLQKLIQNI